MYVYQENAGRITTADNFSHDAVTEAWIEVIVRPLSTVEYTSIGPFSYDHSQRMI